jgi:hypothetical protein
MAGRRESFTEDETAVNLRFGVIALPALLGLNLALASALPGQQSAVPDAPTPQSQGNLPGGPVTPGLGSQGNVPSSSSNSSSTTGQPPVDTTSQPPSQATQTQAPVMQQPADDQPAPQIGNAAMANFIVSVNEVVVPVTVKDSKGNPVAGLTWRDFKIYENNAKENIRVFSVDPAALSIAFVIDQTLPSNIMADVNHSMGAIQGALTPYDEAAVFTYTNGPKEWTGFTGGQSSRLPAVWRWRSQPEPIRWFRSTKGTRLPTAALPRTAVAWTPICSKAARRAARSPRSQRRFTR